MNSLALFKAGDTFELTYSLPIAFGSTIATVSSVVKTSKKVLVEDLDIEQLTDTVEESRWKISADASETLLWPVEVLYCDIKHIASDGSVIHTDTFLIPIEEAQT